MRQFLIAGFLLILISGCTRKTNKPSTISIRAPAESSHKVGALSALPAGRKACYGVNITGPGIPKTAATSCSPETGVVAGFVNPGDLIEAQVERGSNREIKLFIFLQNLGENNPCPQMGASFAASQLSQIYLVGTTSNIEISQEVQTVNIEANFPGVAQNIAVTSSLPSTCVAANPQTSGRRGFRVATASQFATGTGIKMIGRVGHDGANLLSGTNIKLKVK